MGRTSGGVFLRNMFEGDAVDYCFVAMGPDNAIVHVESPVQGWDTTVYMTGGGVSYIHVPTDVALPCRTGNPGSSHCVENVLGNGFHITSTAPISLYASDYGPYSYDITTLLPTTALQSHYIAQHHNGLFCEYLTAFVAVEDSTVLTMRLPCNTRSHQRGDTLNVSLRRGETMTLYTNDYYSQDAEWFTGMEVTSNGRPFAMFNGAIGVVGGLDYIEGYGYESYCLAADHCYEQTLPIGKWGRSYLLTSPVSKSSGDWVVVTSMADSCLLRLDGDNLATLQRDSSLMYFLPADTVQLLTASQPVCVTMFFTGGQCNNDVGDPSSVTLPPLEQGTEDAYFYSINTEGVTDHYVNITATISAVPYITFDGQPIGQYFTPYNESIGYARLHIDTGAHQLRATRGAFSAWFYGLGYYESYAYTAAMALRPQEVQLLVDGSYGPEFTVCQNDTVVLKAFSMRGDTVARWTIDGVEIADSSAILPWCFTTAGNHSITALLHGRCITDWCDTIRGCIEVNAMALTILPDTFCIGAPCLWHGRTIDTTGLYTDTLRSAAGCDSVVQQRIVLVEPGDISITADRTQICEGDTVRISVRGIPMVQWHSTPTDSSLAGQEESVTISVAPHENTTYWLDGGDGNAVSIAVLPTPHPCIMLARDYIDYDDGLLEITDCTEGASSRQWIFGDGARFTSAHVRRHLHKPLPEGMVVTLHVCNTLNCCADTSLWLPLKVQSVWFPNIFVPGYHDDGGFGCRTTLEVEVFELVVYNRRGLLVWSTEDVDARWNGADVPQGTYVYKYYIRSTTGRVDSGTGTVTIVR